MTSLCDLKLQNLPLDIKMVIASYFEYTWVNMAICDDEVRNYSIQHIWFANQFIVCEKIIDGTKYTLFNKYHSPLVNNQYLPAYESKEYQMWYVAGKLHRGNDLPACIQINKVMTWYKHGLLYRDNDQPVEVHMCMKTKLWNVFIWRQMEYNYNYIPTYKNNIQMQDNSIVRHRISGPAYVSNDCKKWYKYGELHRDGDLPAVEREDSASTIHAAYEWYQFGNRHRDNDLPAVIYSYGVQEWYQHGNLHRDNDLPARMCSNGSKGWYKHDKGHRDNDLPAMIHIKGKQKWMVHGNAHRGNDLPALTYTNHKKLEVYYNFGRKHRINGPAVIYSDGRTKYYIDGVKILK